MGAGEPGGAFARMVARAIAESAALHLGEAAQHDETLAKRLERLHGRGELKARAFDGRRPLLHDHADRMEDKSQADGGLGGGVPASAGTMESSKAARDWPRGRAGQCGAIEISL